jgi:hypothetical protein
MTRMCIARRLFLLTMTTAAAASCGDVVRNSRAPVLIVVDSLSGAPGKSTTFSSTLFSDVQTLITTPAPCTTDVPCPTVFNDNGQAAMHLELKDQGTPAVPATPSANNQVTLTRYHVTYRRADGRNTPGVDVPFAFDGAITATLPASGSLNVGFELVRIAAKEEGPLRQLINSPTIITAIADVTFYGTDLVGNAISVTGSITIEFGNFADSQ